MSAKTAIRKFCMWCSLDSYKEVRECPVEDCQVWEFREGNTIKGHSKQKAVRKKCEDCIQTRFTSTCKQKKCPLFPYREGHRPIGADHVKRVISPEHLAKLRAHLPVKVKSPPAEQPTATPIKRRRIGARV